MQTQVLIIGAGATGAGLARDLAMRGVGCAVVESGDFGSGASGGNHGLLHSGARYVSTDQESAGECRQESELLKKMAPQCIEDSGGLFVAVRGDDEDYAARFPGLCAECGIEAQELGPARARELEPVLSGEAMAAYWVPDASVDPFRLCLDNLAQAMDLGAAFLPMTRVEGMETKDGLIRRVHLLDRAQDRRFVAEAQLVVNAAGAWAGEVAALAGASLRMIPSKGSMAITSTRMTQRVVNRLRPPGDGDILVPGGNVSILGTTSVQLPQLGKIAPSVEEVDTLVDEGSRMLPDLEKARFIRAYAGVRPILAEGEKEGESRRASRSFSLLEHGREGAANLLSLTGGKLTTFRLMAERCADLICDRLGISSSRPTREEPLPPSQAGEWIETRKAPKQWLRMPGSGDPLLCECEMVPRSSLEAIVATLPAQNRSQDLDAFRVRSRMGKGPCQGTFCSLRVAKHLFSERDIDDPPASALIKDFLRERWKGLRPVLWDHQLAQSELLEGMYNGLYCLEQSGDKRKDDG